MIVKNAIVLLQFKNVEKIKRNKPILQKRLFVKCLTNIQSNEHALLNSEIFEDEKFEENTKKEVWKLLHETDVYTMKGEYYDNFENKYSERIIQGCTICLLKNDTEIDESWFEISLTDNSLVLSNGVEEIFISHQKRFTKTEITSSTSLLGENNTIILIDALLKLKSEFYFTPMVLDFVNDIFTINDIIEILECFTNKRINKTTIKRRLSNYITPTDESEIFYKKSKLF